MLRIKKASSLEANKNRNRYGKNFKGLIKQRNGGEYRKQRGK